MNKVILVGRLTRDPELRQTPQGISVVRFTIAVNRPYVQRDGQRQADFISCVAWRSTAEFVNRYFHKGSGMQLCGSIQTRSWDGQDGQRHYATEVVADDVEFNGPPRNGQQSGGGYSQQSGGNGYSQPQQPSYNSAPAQQQSGGNGYSQPQQPSYNSAPAQQQSGGNDFAGDLDLMGFEDLDGSEDDLPF